MTRQTPITGSVEDLASIVRVGPGHRTAYDPYTWACTVRWRDPQTVEILAAMRAPTSDEFRAAKAALQAAGATTYIRERVGPDGRSRWLKRTPL